MEGLEQVIVVAHKIEEPTDVLRESVKRNFSKGVRYLFLVSHSNAKNELREGYYRDFELIAQRSIKKYERYFEVSDLVKIHQLPYEWDDYPYIFYRVRDSAAERVKTIAFRGLEKLEGIANKYIYVPPAYARTIAKAILADAPVPLLAYKEFADDEFDDVRELVVGDLREQVERAR